MTTDNHRNGGGELSSVRRGRAAGVLAVAVVAATLALKGGLAWSLGPLADEAYYVVWGQHLALGYFDQPPLVAWVSPVPGPLLRLPAVAAGVVGAVAVAAVSPRPALAALWWLGVPALLWLTLFHTPDALLLGAWAVVISAATRGGRWWLLAGVAWGLAMLAKHPGVAALPLALVALGPDEWRRPWPWLGALVGLVMIAPHMGWLAMHDWVTVRFQAAEGLAVGRPGVWGPLRVLGDQALVLGPWTAAVVAGGTPALWRGRRERGVRVGIVTAGGVLGLFLFASPFGAPEAHWPAPAWVGLGLAVCAVVGRNGARWLAGALWLGALASAVLATHALWGWLPLSPDPASRLRDGAALAAFVEDLPGDIVTERYQEAALIHYMTGRAAVRAHGCGREDQYTLWPQRLPDEMWMIRPRTSGPALCTDATHPRRLENREGDRWQAFRVAR